MKIKVKIEKEVEAKDIHLRAEVRYWEDAILNGEKVPENEDGFPFRVGKEWIPIISIDGGFIHNWPKGKTASIHLKTADQCGYFVVDENGETLIKKDWSYVPDILCPEGDGYGDYIIMKIDETGGIANWKPFDAGSLFSSEEE